MVVAPWIDKTEYPFESKWFEVGKKRLHYVDEGSGDPVLFLHDSPGWSFSYRYLIKGLKSQFRCIAPDFIGFGLSDKPVNWTYRPERDLEYITDFIDSKRLENITLVTHGMGGPIGMGYAIANPSKIKHIVVMNSWMWPLTEVDAVRKIDKTVNGIAGRFLYLSMNQAVRTMMKTIHDRTHFTKVAREHYWNALHEPSERVGPYGYARALLGSSHYFQSLWDRREAVRDIPALAIWGNEDRRLTSSSVERWRIIFPDLEVKRLPNTGPWVMEEKGPGIMPMIEMFLNDTTYLPTASVL